MMMKVKGDGSTFYEVLIESKKSIEAQSGRKMSAEEFDLFQVVFLKLWEADDEAIAATSER